MSTSRRPRKPSARARVRRGHEGDAERLRADLIDATLALFAEGGLDAVSVRAVAARVGVSPMTTYRYFGNKAELLGGLWLMVFQGLLERVRQAVGDETDALARQRALVDAFIGHWEDNPDHYRLVYGGEDRGERREARLHPALDPVIGELIALGRQVTEGVAAAVGGQPARQRLASDVRLAMMLGYLSSRYTATRYPWSNAAVLRATYVGQIAQAVERCLTASE